jgi:2-isopropylmalate synthase
VDVIEAGFAASSNGDFECVKAIANAIKDSTICSLSRANDRDIARAGRSAQTCQPRTHPHLHCDQSPLHMEKKLRMTPDQVFEQSQATRCGLRETWWPISSSAPKMVTAAILISVPRA